jgi:hypothetical protein
MSEDTPKTIFDQIWKQFAADRKDGRAAAAVKLQRALAEHASDLVPSYATAKEFMSMVFDCEQFTKEDKQGDTGDPLTNISDWISGKKDFSRISMIKERTH